MNTNKLIAYILYAVGIVGGVEGATVRGQEGLIISIVALIVIVAGSYLLVKE